MAAVQHAQLHLLVRQHVAHQFGAGLFPGRAPLGKAVLNDPLAERLAGHADLILDAAQPGVQLPAGLRRYRRHNAIHHGGREGDLLTHPVGQRRILPLRQFDQHLARDPAVSRHVIAGHHGERQQPAFTAQAQRRQQQPRRRLRLCRVGDIVRDRRVFLHQPTAGGVVAIALFADGQRDDGDLRLCQGRQHRRQPVGLQVQRLANHADDPAPPAVVVHLRHREQQVLLP